jgi:hypothetical protein
MRCNAPPILGYMSSLLRHWKYFEDVQVGDKGSAYSNISFARRRQSAWARLEVHVVVVRRDDKAGKIAFARAQKRLRVLTNRFYR